MVNVQIRPPADISEVVSFQSICEVSGLPRSIGSIDNSNYFGLMAVTEEDKLVGGTSYSFYPLRKKAIIDALAVHPEHRRESIGTALLEHLIRTMQESGVGSLEVCPLGESLDFYLKKGFKGDYDIDFEIQLSLRIV